MTDDTTTAPDTIEAFLASRSAKETVVEFCLDDDLLAEHAAANSELARLIGAAARTGEDEAATAAIRTAAEAVQAVEQRIDEAQTQFRLRALPWERRELIIATHPAKPDSSADDKKRGYVSLTAWPDLTYACLVSVTLPGAEPATPTREQFDQLLEVVLGAQRSEFLHMQMIGLVWGSARDPKSELASRILKTGSGPKSRRRAR